MRLADWEGVEAARLMPVLPTPLSNEETAEAIPTPPPLPPEEGRQKDAIPPSCRPQSDVSMPCDAPQRPRSPSPASPASRSTSESTRMRSSSQCSLGAGLTRRVCRSDPPRTWRLSDVGCTHPVVHSSGGWGMAGPLVLGGWVHVDADFFPSTRQQAGPLPTDDSALRHNDQ